MQDLVHEWTWDKKNDPLGPNGINETTFPFAVLERLEYIAQLLEQSVRPSTLEAHMQLAPLIKTGQDTDLKVSVRKIVDAIDKGQEPQRNRTDRPAN